jgi:outer membrane protein assembly factor BamB
VANEGLIVVPSAKQGKLLCLKPGGSGDITGKSEFRTWTYPRTPDVPSPVILDGLVYLCREDGVLVCLDAKTGEKLYENRTQPDRHRASPVVADGHVYITARNGTVTVVKTGREFQVVSSNSLGETLSASPAISNGRIYLRSFEKLWAVGK